MEKMSRKRILLTEDQRRALAVKGKALGRKVLFELTTASPCLNTSLLHIAVGNKLTPVFFKCFVKRIETHIFVSFLSVVHTMLFWKALGVKQRSDLRPIGRPEDGCRGWLVPRI